MASKTLVNTSGMQEPPNEKYQILVNLYQRGQSQEALTQVLQLLKRFPKSITLYNMFGAVNQSLGKLDEAIEAYEKVISMRPDFVAAYNNMGVALKDQGKLDDRSHRGLQ